MTRTYTVGYGDTLLGIAVYYGCTVDELVTLNGLPNADSIWVGQQLLVPGRADRTGPSDKLIPDSELVYGPAYQGFDVAAFVSRHNGWLGTYSEEVEGRWLSGADMVQLAVQRYSVGPRVLLALVELRSGGLTDSTPPPSDETPWYPLGYEVEGWEGLWVQLSWAANQLNAGYYGWLERDQALFALGDGTWIQPGPGLNAGTVGVQRVLGAGVDFEGWSALLERFTALYAAWFGDPFAYAVEPLLPAGLTQPPLALPWPAGETWYYTGGPHGGWGNGSSWAAIDITPPGESKGCFLSPDWAVASAPGLVIRSENGEVLIDLDGDGFEGTGWVLLYMHLDSSERVLAGTWLSAGDRVGHPSCEGGFSNGTHLHFARRYNGQWIEADSNSPLPLVLDGWTVQSAGRPYDGWMSKGGLSQEACECREPSNGIAAGN
jgi:murein DD-endopeptidase MepM/ murein hydrolase activator NlpD